MPVSPKAFPSSTGAHALEPQGTRPVCGSARLVGARHTPVKPLCPRACPSCLPTSPWPLPQRPWRTTPSRATVQRDNGKRSRDFPHRLGSRKCTGALPPETTLRDPPSDEAGGVLRQPLRQVVVGQGLLGDVAVVQQQAVERPEVVQEAQQGAQDGGGQQEQAGEDEARHAQQPQPAQRRQGEQGDGDHLQGHEGQQPDGRREHAALPGLAVPQVGHGDAVEVVEAVAGRVVAEVAVVAAVGAQVPLPWGDRRAPRSVPKGALAWAPASPAHGPKRRSFPPVLSATPLFCAALQFPASFTADTRALTRHSTSKEEGK